MYVALRRRPNKKRAIVNGPIYRIVLYLRYPITHHDDERYRQCSCSTSLLLFTSVLRFLRSHLYRPALLAYCTKSVAVNRNNHCCGYPRPLPGTILPGPMHLALDEATKRTAKRKFGLMFNCLHLSKLKPGLKSKSAVATCSLPSCLYLYWSAYVNIVQCRQ